MDARGRLRTDDRAGPTCNESHSRNHAPSPPHSSFTARHSSTAAAAATVSLDKKSILHTAAAASIVRHVRTPMASMNTAAPMMLRAKLTAMAVTSSCVRSWRFHLKRPERVHTLSHNLKRSPCPMADAAAESSAPKRVNPSEMEDATAAPKRAKPSEEDDSGAAAPERAAALQVIRAEFLCPITSALMTDPVMATDGHTYERRNITRALQVNGVSPMTNVKLTDLTLTPNIALRRIMEASGVTSLRSLSDSGRTTQSEALEHASKILARTPTTSTKYNWKRAEGRIEEVWREAVREADERGDFFVVVNITDRRAEKDTSMHRGFYAKLGRGVDIDEINGLASEDGGYKCSRFRAASCLMQCAKAMGFHVFHSRTTSDTANFIAILFVQCPEDIRQAKEVAEKYK